MTTDIEHAADRFRQALGNAVTAALNTSDAAQLLQVAATLGEDIKRMGRDTRLVRELVASDVERQDGACDTAQRLVMIAEGPSVEVTRRFLTMWQDLIDEREAEYARLAATINA